MKFGQTDGRTDGQTDGRTDGRTDIHDLHIYATCRRIKSHENRGCQKSALFGNIQIGSHKK